MKKSFFVFLLAMLLSGGAAFAASWEGEVMSVENDGNSFIAAKVDPKTSQMDKEPIRVMTGSETKFHGIDAVLDLRTGDFVKVEGNESSKNEYNATSVTISKVDIKGV